jgi:hypothetical protein
MRSPKAILGYAALALLQVLGILGFITSNAAAQSEPGAVLLQVIVDRDYCEVQYRKSDSDNWGAQTLEGPPVPCSGGATYGSYMPLAQANREAAAFRSSSTSYSTVVPLTGNADADWASVEAAAMALHESVDTGSPDLAYTSAQDGFLGYSAPGLLQERLQSADNILAAQCRNGDVGQRRRADATIKTFNETGGTRVQVVVVYKRTSCARWTITKVTMTPLAPFSEPRTWFRNFYYRGGAWNGSGYGNREAGKQCRTISYGDPYTFEPGWQIQARHSAMVELIDENLVFPGNGMSCFLGAGTSYSSGWFGLSGGIR